MKEDLLTYRYEVHCTTLQYSTLWTETLRTIARYSTTPSGKSALHLSAWKGPVEHVRALLDRGVNIDMHSTSTGKDTMSPCSCTSGYACSYSYPYVYIHFSPCSCTSGYPCSYSYPYVYPYAYSCVYPYASFFRTLCGLFSTLFQEHWCAPTLLLWF